MATDGRARGTDASQGPRDGGGRAGTTRRTGSARPLRLAVVGLVAATTIALAAGPGFADTPPDPSTTTTTTTTPTPPTTVPAPKAPGAPSSPAPARPAPDEPTPGDTATAEHRRAEGAGPFLPTDSFEAALADLASLRVTAKQLADSKQELVARAAADRAASTEARQALDATRDQRRDRMVRTYVQSGSDQSLEQLLHPSPIVERLTTLASAADRGDQKRMKQLGAKLDALASDVREVEAKLRANDHEAAIVAEQIGGVTAKLAAATAGITAAGRLTPAGIGSGAIARKARLAEEALVALNAVAGQTAAAVAASQAAPGDPNAAAIAADATAEVAAKTDDYAARRAELAGEVGARTGVDGSTFDAVWTASPAPALRAVYFALSQVGKEWVYAMAGPDSYDCSGLTKRAWEQNGISLPHFSGAQLHVGIPIAPADLRPGDLLTYGPGGSEHVVMYIGAGFDVEAKGRAWGLVVESADTTTNWFAGASRPMA